LGQTQAGAASIDGGALMVKEPKPTPSDVRRLRREAERLIAAGEMPSLAELLSVVAEVRAKYRPQILVARKESERLSK
jgi:hypothetical protein